MSGIQKRILGNLGKSGPFLAVVTNHLDPTYMGGLEVVLKQGITGSTVAKGAALPVRYLSPFYGVTSIKFEGNNSSDFNDVQKSYGMWMVPPDYGSTVMVIFVDGDPNQGYWIGCVQDEFQNHMVPGIAATKNASITPEQKRKYGTSMLPVAEFNKSTEKLTVPNPNKISKPVHPFAERLLAQGLIADTIRGVTTSGARREVPSQVFGISTPGPKDTSDGAKQGTIGSQNGGILTPVSRLGGTTFVMDDGDVNGQNELVRIRTRTGHQILLHNSQDLIYIANGQGTAWIELTGNGKIDIYAEDSVSIHSKVDFNFRADRDVNIEAGRSVNINSFGTVDINCVEDFTLICDKDGKIDFRNNGNIIGRSELRLQADGNLHLNAKSEMHQTAAADLHINSGANSYQTSVGNMDLKADGKMKQSSGGDFHVNAGGIYYETASKIHMNGPKAEKAVSATAADAAEEGVRLNAYTLPNRESSSGWSDGKFYKADDIVSTMRRVPTHEPWDHHENVAPNDFSEVQLDNSTPQTITVNYKNPPATKGTAPDPTGNVEQDNIAAFLWMIRVCEGTYTSDGYKTMYTGKLFSSYAEHPNQANTAKIGGKSVTSTAAGAYQFLYSTWNECKRALALTDFSPPNQDKAAIYLIQSRGALSDVKAGNFTKAVDKCKTIWASLPGSPYGQNPKQYAQAVSYYKQAGGKFVA